MTPDNPYQPPATNLETSNYDRDDVWEFTEPNRLSAGRGWFWITEGFRLFARSPGIWIANMIIYFVIMIVLSVLPLVSIVTYILQPIFMGGFMRGSHELDTEGHYEVNHLFAGFHEKGSKLAILGALQLGIMILYGLLIFIIAAVFLGTTAFLTQDGASDPEAIFTGAAFIILIPVFIISLLALGMAFWLAPQLVMLHDLEAVNSIKMSFIGSWRNLLPIIVFVILLLVFFMLAMIPFGLGIFVMWPVMMAATYVAWKDIFTRAYPL